MKNAVAEFEGGSHKRIGEGARPLKLFGRVRHVRGQWHQCDDIVPDILRCLRVVSEFAQGARRRQAAALSGFSFSEQGQRVLRIAQRVIDIVARRKTAGEVGKPDADRRVRSGILNNGNVMRHLQGLSIERPLRLLIDITNQAFSQVLLGVRQNDDFPRFRVFEDVVGAGNPVQDPAFLL